eukprot:1407371-Prymnesium_polylepis.1
MRALSGRPEEPARHCHAAGRAEQHDIRIEAMFHRLVHHARRLLIIKIDAAIVPEHEIVTAWLLVRQRHAKATTASTAAPAACSPCGAICAGKRSAPAALAPVCVVKWKMKCPSTALTAPRDGRSNADVRSWRSVSRSGVTSTAARPPLSVSSKSAVISSSSHHEEWERSRKTILPACKTFCQLPSATRTASEGAVPPQAIAGKKVIPSAS